MHKNIAVLEGDGIGPEVVQQAQKALDAVAHAFGHQFTYVPALIGAAAIDATGEALPTETLRVCQEADAVLFGAIGDPKYDNDPKAKVRPEQGLLALRKGLGLYANIRPVTTFDSLLDKSPLKNDRIAGADFVVVRELTGGIYFGEPRGRRDNDQVAFDTCVYSKEEVIRIGRLAFEMAGKRRKKLCSVDKANVLETSRLWRETMQELASEYPDVELSHQFVDSAAMDLIVNPTRFDVIVTENMFGDILTDEASVITGSLGLLPSASIGLKTSLFEPIHGSFPQAKGKGIANPIATIASAAMLLEDAFDMKAEAKAIRDAIEQSMKAGKFTPDLAPEGAVSTQVLGDFIAETILTSVNSPA
ncbi:MAG: 3-isopropylmalate dehydrogenase [Flavobacteriales bacterium]|nr:3-isopropylmalate dehydrogenase [Flavobacteriales bacterium]MCB9449479.1 3-isopropylmalate dehydrogenase [Flavobacteriales bacterium]